MDDAKQEPRCNFPGHRLAAIKAVVQDCLECGVTIVTPVNPYQPGAPATTAITELQRTVILSPPPAADK